MTGLLDVVLDPDFASNHTIYFTYFEYFDKTVYNTSVARAVLDENGNAIRDVKVLLKTHPFAPNDQTLAAGTKTGGRIAVGRDGYLYITVGDRDNAGPSPWPVAQYLDTASGQGDPHHQGRRARAWQSFCRQSRRAAGDLGLWHPQPGGSGFRAQWRSL